MFDIQLQTTTESMWKILELDRKTPGIFFLQKSGNPDKDEPISLRSKVRVTVRLHMVK